MRVNLKIYHDDDGCENVSFYFLSYTDLKECDTDGAAARDDESEGADLSGHHDFAGFVKEWARHPEYQVVYTVDIYNGCNYYRRVVTRVGEP